jgi:hypothetical protein
VLFCFGGALLFRNPSRLFLLLADGFTSLFFFLCTDFNNAGITTSRAQSTPFPELV